MGLRKSSSDICSPLAPAHLLAITPSTSLQPQFLLLMLISISRYHAMVWCYGEG